jgi:hypothetical protein
LIVAHFCSQAAPRDGDTATSAVEAKVVLWWAARRFHPTRRSPPWLSFLQSQFQLANGSPDADLIELGREFDRITTSWADLLQSHGDTDTEIRKINQLHKQAARWPRA